MTKTIAYMDGSIMFVDDFVVRQAREGARHEDTFDAIKPSIEFLKSKGRG